MSILTLSKMSLADLKTYVRLQEQGVADYSWTQVEGVALTEAEQYEARLIQSRLLKSRPQLMNEATIWARGIYPLLALAEQGAIQAMAEVELEAHYPHFAIKGIADGVLGKCTAGYLEAPYLVVVEAKRGLEAGNPQFQLYGQLLAAAYLNWQDDHQPTQEIFGCYTISDVWTFLRVEVTDMEADMPTMTLEASREYMEKLESETILKILKEIVARHL